MTLADLSSSITDLQGVAATLTAQLSAAGSTTTAAQTAQLGQVVTELRYLADMAQVQAPASAFDPEAPPVY